MSKAADLQEKLSHLPKGPGVYLMKGEGDRILYVGKANVLSDRVRSYFQKGSSLSPRIASLVSHISDLEVMVTKSELEALILENNLIKKHRPKYNVVFRDDKTYPYLRLSIQKDFPRLEVVRRFKQDGALYFGPYTPSGAMHETLRFLRRLFPLPNCNITIDGTLDRPCIEYEIKRCLAPCTGQQSQSDYREMMNQVRLFLEGKDTELLKALRKRMEIEAAKLNFEEAARLRDQIGSIEQTLERQRITSPELSDLDVIAGVRGGESMDFQVLFIRGGLLVGRKDFFLKSTGESSEGELYRTFIQQFYNKEGLIPPRVVSAGEPVEMDLLEKWLSTRRESAVRLTVPRRGKILDVVRLARENAQASLEEHLRVLQAGTLAAREVQRILGLRRLPERIEGFDISNIMGEQAVGSRVVLENGKAKKSAYRKFRIRTIQGADDFGMMNEMLYRWYSHAVEKEEPLPDLILIDGGKGQLSAARAAIRKAGVTDRDIIGLAKAKHGKGERVFLPGAKESIPLDPSSPATHLLQRVRDEAHRFAIRYHRSIRGKEMTFSVLDDVPGIGEKKKRELLKHFGGLEAIKSASLDDLLAVPGITQKLAGEIQKALKPAP